MSIRRAGTARLLATLAAAAAASLLAAPAGAQVAPRAGDEQPRLALSVQELTGTLSPGDELVVRARVSNRGSRTVEGLRVVGTLHRAVASRFQLQRAVDDGEVGTVLEGFSAEIDELRPGRSTVVDLGASAAQLGFRRADQFGVYPLRLQLLEQGDAVGEQRTAVVLAPEQVEEPVRAAFLLPLETGPLLHADGSYDRRALLAELSRAGRVQGLIGSLASRPGFAATLAPDGLLLQEADELAGGFFVRERPGDREEQARPIASDEYLARQAQALLDRVTEVAGRPDVDVLAVPYARADLAALVRGGMPTEAVRHVREGRTVVTTLAGAAPLPGALWPADALNAATLGAIAGAGVDALVLSERHLDVPEGRALTPSPVRELARTARTSPAVLVPDPWLEQLLGQDTAPDGVALTVQRVLAETAAVYFERPFAEDVRGLLLAPPQSWDPQRGLPVALFDGLAGAPWLQPVTLTRLARGVEAEASPVRLRYGAEARERELPSSYIAELRQARHSLGSLAGVLASGDDTPSRFDRKLLAAASVHARTPPQSAQGAALIHSVSGTVAEWYASVRIVSGPEGPDGPTARARRVVWTDVEGRIPVTVANNAPVPLRVRVELESTRFEIDEEPVGQPADDRGGWVLEPGETRTFTFEARAVTPGGRAPIRVVVWDVDGVFVLASGTVIVRSTAVSVAAVVVTGAAGLFLLVWLVQQATRRRRRPRQPSGASRRREPPQHGGNGLSPLRQRSRSGPPPAQAGGPARR